MATRREGCELAHLRTVFVHVVRVLKMESGSGGLSNIAYLLGSMTVACWQKRKRCTEDADLQFFFGVVHVLVAFSDVRIEIRNRFIY